MAASDYSSALKQGRRSYRTALTKGEYPYLPVLDDMIFRCPRSWERRQKAGLMRSPIILCRFFRKIRSSVRSGHPFISIRLMMGSAIRLLPMNS